MRVLLSSIGSRGDIQPILALGLELRGLSHQACLCVPPNFQEWVVSYGLECVPIGPDVRKLTGGTVPGKPVLPSKEQLQKMADDSVRTQFQVIGEAARDCDLILGATALQFAARSIAEKRGIPYIFTAYCPAVLPSPKYPPTVFSSQFSFSLSEAENLRLWEEDALSFRKFGAVINEERAKIGLEPISSVRDYMFTNRPWLAADPVLAPASPVPGLEVVQTGAWMLPVSPTAPPASTNAPASTDAPTSNNMPASTGAPASTVAPLPADLEAFLAAGDPPIYLGFGSMRESEQMGRVLIESIRALGLRAILYQGWADLTTDDTRDDCLVIGDVDHTALFPRVAAVVHHGGAGTTHTTVRAGRAQVIVPHNYDQFYWAHRVQQMGIGVSGPLRDELTVATLVPALRACLQPEVTERARSLAGRMELHGASIAAKRLAGEETR
jgi:vancomycin aglycone glucosyltransferase